MIGYLGDARVVKSGLDTTARQVLQATGSEIFETRLVEEQVEDELACGCQIKIQRYTR